VPGVAQFVPVLHPDDAVGSHALALHHLLEAKGVRSAIYVELEDPATASLTRLAARYPAEARPGDVLWYQFATASDLAGWLIGQPQPLVVNYHNVTPPEFFAPWDNPLARHQVRAQGELGQLARRAALGVAVSAFNCADLDRAGYARTAVVPPLVTLPEGPGPARRPLPPCGARWLMVGRLAPNKAVEETLAGLLAHRRLVDPKASLEVVGRPAVPGYARALRTYAEELGLGAAVRFRGALSAEDLDRAYREADVLVVTSRHEGFCLPVVEAMARDLPVVAGASGALPEVLGGAGVLFSPGDVLALSAAVGALAEDPKGRDRAVAAGRQRIAELDLARAGDRLYDLVGRVASGGVAPAGR
jgi:glycosyltransferase involved in cell wall biosynthesis